MQQGTGFNFPAWQPVNHKGTEQFTPHVRAPYYGYVFVADFIGPSKDYSLRIKNLDLKNHTLSAYAGYESGTLQKIAVVNLFQWNSTETIPRPVERLTLDLPTDVKQVTVEKLTGPGASSFNGTTWGGVEWSFGSHGIGVRVANDTQTVDVTTSGVVDVSVQASEAILVRMIRQS
jgi:hypothetical protein